MNRRDFFVRSSAFALGSLAAQHARPQAAAADVTLRIAPAQLELAPGKVVHTTAYNGTAPGPLVRWPEGKPITLDVFNDTAASELAHWHGLWIPSDVDGAMEEGTPMIPAHGHARYTFTPRPAGLRWYHSHAYAGHDLKKSGYSGQHGFFVIEPRANPARYDQEIFLALHDWNAYMGAGNEDGFMNVVYDYASINGRMLGSGDPIRVRERQRVLLRILNASATETHWLTLAGHRFQVVALDGNAVPHPIAVDALRLAPAERVDAIVEMSQPGVWILGDPQEPYRKAGLGIAVEYAGRQGPPQWVQPAALAWDYLVFAGKAPAMEPDEHVPLVFRQKFAGHGDFDHWTINGKSFPKTDSIMLRPGRRYRLVMDNQSMDDHPVHLHRHSFEIASMEGRPGSGIMKDVVIVKARSKAEVDVVAANPGPSLFHCHQQSHMDFGFMMLFRYSA